MTPDEHVAAISEHAEAVRASAAKAGLDAATPTCPGWTVRDVVGHLGGVHRWAASFVEEARTDPPSGEVVLETPPADPELLDWFRDGYEHLVKVLSAADDTVECWTFLPA